MNIAYLLIGGNLGNRQENLAAARFLIGKHCGQITRESSVYETAPWGKIDQPGFLNQALEVNTGLNARQLIRRILRVEKSMGRVRKEKLGPRIIDIDILLFNNEIQDISFLKVPHPEMQYRRFVLIPLSEIAAEIVHPVLKKNISELLHDCTDELDVKKITD